ncbi:arginase [Oxobacter pfennigii]|uniref:Arginase n=1 Tax=Oxobacter pfennigii TaxID=36849 RepID=A0A0P8YUV0_9CLOT|nr:arginase family protein [Oxobacter pfennigii]KPU43475.1 arginase [Oxobacter pfennigii]
MKNHLNLFFPQWQGSGNDDRLLHGALELKEVYFEAAGLKSVDVSSELDCVIENNILGLSAILKQFEGAKKIIDKEKPDTIFVIGGGCDIEILPVSYMNAHYNGQLTVLWIDAHGDLNTPESSASKNFDGMPLRVLLGEGNEHILDMTYSFLRPDQVLLLGQRDLDAPEEAYIKEHGLEQISVEQMEADAQTVIDALHSKFASNIYIHIDLDVIDYSMFSHVMAPSPDGLKTSTLVELIKGLNAQFHVVGISILECLKTGGKSIGFISEIVEIGTSL